MTYKIILENQLFIPLISYRPALFLYFHIIYAQNSATCQLLLAPPNQLLPIDPKKLAAVAATGERSRFRCDNGVAADFFISIGFWPLLVSRFGVLKIEFVKMLKIKRH